MSNRVFLIVLDSFGVGEMPDASVFSDKGSNTLRSISKSRYFNITTLKEFGLFNIDGIDYLESIDTPNAAYGRLSELSQGKDTTIGHWEISGIVSHKPLPTYVNGFPKQIIDEFSMLTGRGVLCNKPYSGTEVIKKYGQQHIESGDLIVYTSADSVFQIAAHEDVVPIEELYEYCRIARKLLTGEHGVGRVIARPFTGTDGNFTRTANRHDFSLEPPDDTVLNYLKNAGLDTIAVGKIYDIFAGSGITEYAYTKSNQDGMNKADFYLDKDFCGLCFINLVDFDMIYGHRNDVDGYANALSEFDAWLKDFITKLKKDDLLIITADHGCDPGYIKSTDHTREYVPLIVYGDKISPRNLGTMAGFCNIGKSICDYFKIKNNIVGKSFLEETYEK